MVSDGSGGEHPWVRTLTWDHWGMGVYEERQSNRCCSTMVQSAQSVVGFKSQRGNASKQNAQDARQNVERAERRNRRRRICQALSYQLNGYRNESADTPPDRSVAFCHQLDRTRLPRLNVGCSASMGPNPSRQEEGRILAEELPGWTTCKGQAN